MKHLASLNINYIITNTTIFIGLIPQIMLFIQLVL